MRTYNELIQFSTLEERYDYLKLGGMVGEATFGFDRWMNQAFYRSAEWRNIRQEIIVRDLGMDLGVHDVPIRGQHYVHHMNPITLDDIEEGSENLIHPQFLILVSHQTHNAIHYGDERQLPQPFIERTPGDTRDW